MKNKNIINKKLKVKVDDYDYSKGKINEKIDKCMELILELNELKEEDFNGFEMSKFENFCYNVRDLKMFK